MGQGISKQDCGGVFCWFDGVDFTLSSEVTSHMFALVPEFSCVNCCCNSSHRAAPKNPEAITFLLSEEMRRWDACQIRFNV